MNLFSLQLRNSLKRMTKASSTTSTVTALLTLPIRPISITKLSSITGHHRLPVTVTASTTQCTRTLASTKTCCTNSTWPRWATAWESRAIGPSEGITATPRTLWPSSACTATSGTKKRIPVLVKMPTRRRGLEVRKGSVCAWTVIPATATP